MPSLDVEETEVCGHEKYKQKCLKSPKDIETYKL